MDSALGRIENLAHHLEINDTAAPITTASVGHIAALPVLDKDKVARLKLMLLAHPSDEVMETRRQIMEVMKEPLFTPQLYATIPEFREITLQRVKRLASSNILKLDELMTKFRKFVMFQDSLVYCDMSMAVKSSVQWGLFGGSVACLGTERHRSYFTAIDTAEMLGCFALTELGHGSNVKGVETTATYDEATKEFVIHTPQDTAQKIWIGNAAQHGTHATVFANLYVRGASHGLHPFLVAIRDPATGKTLKGITAADCGPKMGLDGVDNGRLWFDNVRVPGENLLNKFGDVDARGNYTTPIANPNVRFNAMLEALIGGRVTVSSMAMNASKMGLEIAIKYALQRRQFGAPKEELLIDYLSHQRRLFPLVAATYAYGISVNYVAGRFANRDERDARDVFLLACGFKATATWHRARTLQICREACGGMGFAASNKIGVLRNDADVDLTYEGDNTVLMQAVAKALLVEFKSYFTGSKRITGMLSYTYAKGHIGIFLRNKNFYVKRLHTEAHLLDAEMLLDAFIYREFKLLRMVVKSLRSKVKNEKMTGAKAWNQSLDLVQQLATAYVERVTIERFLDEIQKSDDGVKPILNLMCILFALTKIEDDMGWFLSNKYFAPVKAQAINSAINKICGMMREHALPLVEAFDIPAHLMTAPIANDYIAHYSNPKNY
uniref:Acyl-coenzyme A oxidase n=1 Tax=Synstelium polycarpum TaxID=361085 RepID=A0A1L2FV02_9MYCE|nr:putative acyl-CoA oxidase [Synstelium polycarpum]|eukprot:gene13679-16111_t